MGASRSRALAMFAAPFILVSAATTHGTVSSRTAVSVSFGQIATSHASSAASIIATASAGSVSDANYVGQLGVNEHWTHFPLSVAFNASSLSTPDRDAAAACGFNKWVAATHSHVAVRFVSDPAQADVVVRFDPSVARSETHIDFDPTSHVITHASVVIGIQDEENPRVLACDDDIRGLAAHEFGHALGIDGHSKNQSDLMYPTLDGNLSVTVRDLNTLRAIYSDRI